MGGTSPHRLISNLELTQRPTVELRTAKPNGRTLPLVYRQHSRWRQPFSHFWHDTRRCAAL